MKTLTFVRWSRAGRAANRLQPGALIPGLVWAMSVSAAVCVIMCAWVVLSAGPVYNFSSFVAAGAIMGALWGGGAAGKSAGALGAVHGLITGSLYGLLLAALVTAGSPAFSAADLAWRVAGLGVAGAVGGLLGVNSHLYRGRSLRQGGYSKSFTNRI